MYVCMNDERKRGLERKRERERVRENLIVSDSLAFFATFSRTNRIYNRGVTVVFVKKKKRKKNL